MTEYKMDDGWDLDECSPLGDFISCVDTMQQNVYELRNCVRTKSLIDMRNELLEEIEMMKASLEDIGDDDYITEGDDDE